MVVVVVVVGRCRWVVVVVVGGGGWWWGGGGWWVVVVVVVGGGGGGGGGGGVMVVVVAAAAAAAVMVVCFISHADSCQIFIVECLLSIPHSLGGDGARLFSWLHLGYNLICPESLRCTFPYRLPTPRGKART